MPECCVCVFTLVSVQPALRGGALMTLRQKSMMLNGPLFLINGGNFAAIVRLPIYIPNSTFNETFGTNRNCESQGQTAFSLVATRQL